MRGEGVQHKHKPSLQGLHNMRTRMWVLRQRRDRALELSRRSCEGSLATSGAFAYIPTVTGALYQIRLSENFGCEKVTEIKYREAVWSADLCGNRLAVGTASSLYLYELDSSNKINLVWKVMNLELPWKVTFSPDCEFIAVSELLGKRVRIYIVKNKMLLFEKEH